MSYSLLPVRARNENKYSWRETGLKWREFIELERGLGLWQADMKLREPLVNI